MALMLSVMTVDHEFAKDGTRTAAPAVARCVPDTVSDDEYVAAPTAGR
jgi:hypothetical protein